MDPWRALGWILLVVIGGGLALLVATMVLASLLACWYSVTWRLRSRRDRKTAPAAGQVWVSVTGKAIEISEILWMPEGKSRVCLTSKSAWGRSTWSETLEEWELRRKAGHLVLLEQESKS